MYHLANERKIEDLTSGGEQIFFPRKQTREDQRAF